VETKIEKFNEAYLRIKCDPDIGRELSEFFTFEVEGARFMPSVRAKVWDGRIRLFSPGTGKIYYGLLPYVQRFLTENGHTYNLSEDFEERKLERSLTAKFVWALQKGKLKAREYQIDAIHKIITDNRGLILSPTGSGKSFIIYALVRYYLRKQDKKILIIVPTTGLVEQMYNDFADYGWFPDEHCHKLYAGKDKNTSKEVVISTWQSIYKLDTRYFSQFGCVVVDEAHLAKAKSLTGIMTKLHDCKYRVGLTGTLDGTEIHRLVLEGLFSVHEQVTTTSELIEKKQLSPLHIRVLVLEHNKFDRQMMKDKTYQQEMEFLSTNMKRNQFIRSLVCATNGNILVLAQYIEKQLVPLCNMIVDHCGKDRTVHLIYGATPTDDREKVRQLVEKDDNAVIVASYGTFSTGVNIKRIHAIIFASPYKSQVKVLQSIGRGLRVADDKEELELFDIADDLRYNGKENYTLKHLHERIQIYSEQSFDYDIVPVKLEKNK
jgi:superfamily II DNA or RNA helicase